MSHDPRPRASVREMGLRDVRLIQAIYQSAAEAGRWIELNEDGPARS